MKITIRRSLAWGLLGVTVPAIAQIGISDVPLFLSVNVAPNVIITIDDSGSMDSAYMPDSKALSTGNKTNIKRFSSYPWNGQYYDPLTTYTIPTRRDGVSYGTSFTAAYNSGFDATTAKVDLSKNYKLNTQCKPSSVTSSCNFTTTTAYPTQAAFYHRFYSDLTGASKPSGCSNSNPREDENCYIKVVVGSAADIAAGTAAQKQQNFANWYSFYRTRALAAISAAMGAVTTIDTDQVRLAWQSVASGFNPNCDQFGTTCKGYDSATHENRMRSLDAPKSGDATKTHRTDFYDWIARLQVGAYTPLRSALNRAGQYYTTSGVNSPYAANPYVDKGTELSCRKNFNLLITDGLWNQDNNVDFGGNTDGTSHTLPDGKGYSATNPYKDTNSNSLADIAFKYWYTDLRTDLADNVPAYVVDRSGTDTAQYWNPRNDPATWQHMDNFTIGLGLSSVLLDPAWGGSTYAGDFAALSAGTKSWPAINEAPTPGSEPVGHVYDLWHAAINSRGQFFSADNPAAAGQAFKSVFNSILNASSSAAALTANSTSIQTGTMVYQATFSSADWHGQLIAYSVNTNGTIGNAQWDASTRMPAAASRSIFTFDGTTGKAFSSCGNLNATEKLALDTDSHGTVDNLCSDRLAWLRGDNSKEARNGGAFRDRKISTLGDIIHSDPIFVQTDNFGYATASGMTEKSSYAAFVAGKNTRSPMVYVGSNDGMLHAFRADAGNADSGKEIFAYVPAGVYPKLSQLTDPGYSHTYYVDGAPSSGDAYWGGSWKSVLVGGLGAGGKSVYALDISNPDSFSAANVLWEYSDATGLGNTFSQPQIVRLNTGEWAAVFGNGYNSTSDKAFLYIVRLSDGTLIKKIPAGNSSGNGLSTPMMYDTNGDGIMDTAYAGDLLGNLWKFDLSSTNAATWALANGAQPLFTALNTQGQAQPITAQPTLGAHPSGGLLIYFGTGRYLTTTDPGNTDVQSFYAVWDNGTSGTVSRSQLQIQSILSETAQFNALLRETSDNGVDWAGGKRGWYMDLVVPPTTSAGPGGERIISRALLKYDRVIFSTVVPSTDACLPGGFSWLMELNVTTGGRLAVSAYDLNNDGQYDTGDNLSNGNVASGVKSTVGIFGTPTWLNGSGNSDYKEFSGTSGSISTIKNRRPPTMGTVKRIFWQQIQ
ncbi:type IV pilus assembly protein PilY1 [Novimethylophilus kurashikiensis]|uniref:Type IV pilus assembly protein PilY1 n=1 Tax=Novimethylophilus kurashikiensis TaxID=1825523 RepID=A0A2R5F793_9PROT|nr:PilC/PilY family type IV pilus protein [Novimethylophilus kurashikiensis]GBG12504.1 type IV pilus assembly protein PilY1 [Novimethylophilus kurashikiensis]